jgi:hypothetical protein
VLATNREGHLVIVEPGREEVRLPVPPPERSGWVPDSALVWLAGEGLRLLTVGDAYLLTAVADPADRVSDVVAVSSTEIRWLEAAGVRRQAFAVDLAVAQLAPRALGDPFVVDEGETIEWSPDGRFLAMAGPRGLAVREVATGTSRQVSANAAHAPRWAGP